MLCAALNHNLLVVFSNVKSTGTKTALARSIFTRRWSLTIDQRGGLSDREVLGLSVALRGKSATCWYRCCLVELLDLLGNSGTSHEAILLFILFEHRCSILG